MDFFVSFGFKVEFIDQKKYLKVVRAIYTIGLLWLSLDIQGKYEDYMKFYTSFLFAKYADQRDLPQSSWPLPGVFVTGPLHKWLSNRMRDHLADNYVLYFSLLQWKRGASPLGVRQVVENLKGHAELMSSQFTTPDDILATVAHVARDIGFKAQRRYEKKGGFKVPAPSVKACYEMGIAQGGSKKAIYNMLPSSNFYEQSMFVRTRKDRESIYYTDSLPFWDERDGDDLTTGDVVVIDFVIPKGDPIDCFSAIEENLVDRVNNTVEFEAFRAKVVAIPEPFKTRVITKSESLLNYYGKPMQKLIHSVIRKTDWGAAIGRPLVEADMDFFSHLDKKLKVVSGDYKSATDRLNADASRLALRSLLEVISINEESLLVLMETLNGQVLEYDKTIDGYKNEPYFDEAKAELPQETLQTNGQLMGSILSFVILCIINAAVFLHTARIYLDDPWFTLDDAFEFYGLRINGDDILYAASDEFIDQWMENVRLVGLIPSLGKNYISADFFTINSMLFVLQEGKPKYRPFLNSGLLYATNPHISTSNVAVEPITFASSAEAIQARFLEGFEGDQFLEWLFLRRNQEALEKCSFGRNWFIPTALGGLGLKTSSPELVKVNDLQSRVATYLATRAKPEQIWEEKLSLSLQAPTKEMISAQKAVSSFGDLVGWKFGGYSPDEILLEALSQDPFGIVDLPKQNNLHKMSRRIIPSLKRMCNSLGGWITKVMSYDSMCAFARDDPGFVLPYEVTSDMGKTVYSYE